MRYTIYIFLLLFFPLISFSQGQTDNWYFGNKAALNFATCNPVVVSGSQINTIEGCATISDAGGNLLFYTDGIKVWNKNNTVMQNGTGLFGDPSSTQSGVIVPQPGNDSIYYIFTPDVEGGIKGLNYSIVNINLNGGLGAVIAKNINLLGSTNEKVTAIRHKNQQDIWVITRQFQSDKYYTWQVTPNGISTSPIISTSPNYLGNPIDISRGYLKPSTDGKYLVSAFARIPFLEIANFDDATGQISNFKKIKSIPPLLPQRQIGEVEPYGVEFSPNSKLLYITTQIGFGEFCPGCPTVATFIHQYNISIYDSATISNSAVLIDSSGSPSNTINTFFTALQLAKNGKIYVGRFQEKKIGVINNPNLVGTACNFQANGITLTTGVCMGGLPTFIQTYFSPNFQTYDFGYVEDCNKTVNFTLNTQHTYDSLRWNFDDTPSGINNTSTIANPTHNFTNGGLHNVQLLIFRKYGCLDVVDTVPKAITIGATWFNFGADTSFCTGDSIKLDATVTGNATYLWSTGATTPTIKIFTPNNYWCAVTRGGCTYREDIGITEKFYPIVNLGNDATLCEDQTLPLDATNTNSTYQWQDNTINPTYTVTKAGQYFVTVNKQGCIAKDTINVLYNLKPRFTLGEDKFFCLGNSIILDPKIIDVNYTWQDGSNTPIYRVTQPGTYSLTATNTCGTAYDDIKITQGVCELYVPNAFTPNGDAINPVFKAAYGDNVKLYRMQVFNRYGQLVFATKNKSTGWDGTVNGQKQPQGTYTWIIEYNTVVGSSMQVLTGTVMMLR